jgi:hypothetical protein
MEEFIFKYEDFFYDHIEKIETPSTALLIEYNEFMSKLNEILETESKTSLEIFLK